MGFPISRLEEVPGTSESIKTSDNKETDPPLRCSSVTSEFSSYNMESIEAPEEEQLLTQRRQITHFKCNQCERVNIYNYCVGIFFPMYEIIFCICIYLVV